MVGHMFCTDRSYIFIAFIGKDQKVQFLLQNDKTLNQPIHTQAGLLIHAQISHMYGGMIDWKLEILAYIWEETHNIHILYSLFFMHFIVETHALRP